MEMALAFNEIQFDVVDRENQPWIRLSQLATALGYGQRSGQIDTPFGDAQLRKLYARHADEFSDTMTAVVKLPTEGGEQETRIFSLRGCHLIAMLARTPVAKAFRKWVLDVLDRIAREENAVLQTKPEDRLSKRTDPERKQLTGIINTWVGMAPIHYATARAQVNAHFGVTGIDELTVAQVKEAIQWVQGKIDALAEKLPVSTLPPAMLVQDVDIEGKYREYLEEVEKWRIATRAEYERLYREGMKLLEVERVGTAIFEMNAAFISLWLKEAALSHISVFDHSLKSYRAPVVLAANLNSRFESVGDFCAAK